MERRVEGCYCLEVEAPSAKTSSSPSLRVLSLFCLFAPLELAQAHWVSLSLKTYPMVFGFACILTLAWSATVHCHWVSITWFAPSLTGWSFSIKICISSHLSRTSLIREVRTSSFIPSSSERAFQLPSVAVPSEGLGVPWWSAQCGGPPSIHHHPPASP